MNSEVEFLIDGKKRGLRNDMLALRVACRKDSSSSLSEILDRVRQKDDLAFICLLYGCAVSYHEKHSMSVDFTLNDMEVWISEVGAEQMAENIKELFKSPEVPKNSKSPQETGITATA